MSSPVKPVPVKAVVVYPLLKTREFLTRSEESLLAESIGLAEAIDLDVVYAELVKLNQLRPATLIGSGVVERLKAEIDRHQAGLVIIDGTVSPIQQRNLEKAFATKVIDRTGLILEIFGARARTAEGVLQVELAALEYQKSRLVRSWTHLERQRGGFGFLGGPGESQLELDRRIISNRIEKIRSDLATVARTRANQRTTRQRHDVLTIALVGYTNAGKSTLFNRLTGAGVLAQDMLFATLDPTLRGLVLPSGRKAVLADTVGFIANLPTQLVAAFKATLEEVLQADVILHVRDCAHPESEAQRLDVLAVLTELGLDVTHSPVPIIEVLNKVDRLPPALRPVAEIKPRVVPVSAMDGSGVADLLRAIDLECTAGREILAVTLESRDGAALSWLYRHGTVLERQEEEAVIRLSVALEPADVARWEKGKWA